ncbi:MAG: zinc ABC transporter substrate-binding protein [Bacilli bacterium]|nr:zinc ABC transporter substrate-binding protein [Bacilli bacterium]
MKKILSLLMILLLCGCDITEDFTDKYIYTTIYPVEYATNMLYKEHSNIISVYPNGADTKYEVTDKKKEKYAQGEIFIYSGVAKEAHLAKDLLNKNNKIKLIDATKGLVTQKEISAIWLDPSNYLMLCSNIKSSLIDYTDNVYEKEEIEKNYKKLNETISELDVLLYDIGKNGNYDTILTTNDIFSYLSKYNINVISIDQDNQSIDKAYANAKKLIKDKKIQYIYTLEGDKLSDTQKKFITDNALIQVEINDLYTLTDKEREENKDYISLMNEIIDNYKKELYKKK